MKESTLDLIAKNYKYYYLFALFFIPVIPLEISNHLVSIPTYENLNIDSGYVTHTRTTGRWGRQLILISNAHKIRLTCHLHHSSSRYCPPFEVSNESDFYRGKHVIARWYHHSFIGYSNSNILLELEIDGKKFISYATQKEKYLKQAGEGSHFGLMITLFLLSLGIWGNLMSYKIKKSLKHA